MPENGRAAAIHASVRNVGTFSRSRAEFLKNCFIDIGDEQSIENDLSTYNSHLLNMKYFIKNSNNKTLILIDEFGSGTEPQIGGAIASASNG